jgi:hypothetical protein
VVLAEDEQAVSNAGWQPFSADRGYAPGDNVVTVLSVVTISQPTFTAGKGGLNHAQIISEVIGQIFAYRSYAGIRHSKWYPFEAVAFFILGIFAPVKTPEAVFNRMRQEIVCFVRAAEAKKKFFDTGVETVGSSPAEFAARIKSDIAKTRKVIKD